jgi:hypothetical protein
VSLACACLMVGTAAQAPEWGQAFGPGRLAALRQMMLDSPDPQLIANLQGHMTPVQAVQATSPAFALGPSGRGAERALTNPTAAHSPTPLGADVASTNPTVVPGPGGHGAEMASTNPMGAQSLTNTDADMATAAFGTLAVRAPAVQNLMPGSTPNPGAKALMAEPTPAGSMANLVLEGQGPTSIMLDRLPLVPVDESVNADSPLPDMRNIVADSSMQRSMPEMANVSMADLSLTKQAAVAAMQSAGASPAWLEAYKGVLAWGYDTIMAAVMYDR